MRSADLTLETNFSKEVVKYLLTPISDAGDGQMVWGAIWRPLESAISDIMISYNLTGNILTLLFLIPPLHLDLFIFTSSQVEAKATSNLFLVYFQHINLEKILCIEITSQETNKHLVARLRGNITDTNI